MVRQYYQLIGHESEQTLGDMKDRKAWCAAVHGIAKSLNRQPATSVVKSYVDGIKVERKVSCHCDLDLCHRKCWKHHQVSVVQRLEWMTVESQYLSQNYTPVYMVFPRQWGFTDFSHLITTIFAYPHVTFTLYAVLCLVAQSCLTLCDFMDCNPPGSSVLGDSRHKYWRGLPFPSPGDLPNPGIGPRSPALQVDSLLSEPQGNPRILEWAAYPFSRGTS